MGTEPPSRIADRGGRGRAGDRATRRAQRRGAAGPEGRPAHSARDRPRQGRSTPVRSTRTRSGLARGGCTGRATSPPRAPCPDRRDLGRGEPPAAPPTRLRSTRGPGRRRCRSPARDCPSTDDAPRRLLAGYRWPGSGSPAPTFGREAKGSRRDRTLRAERTEPTGHPVAVPGRPRPSGGEAIVTIVIRRV